MPNIRLLWVLGIVIAHQLLSMLWYSPWLFAFKWLRFTGLSPADIDPKNITPFIISIIASSVLVYFMVWFFKKLAVRGVLQGIKCAVLFWCVFFLMTELTHAAFAQKPVALVLIDAGRDLLVFALTGGLLGYYFHRQVSE